MLITKIKRIFIVSFTNLSLLVSSISWASAPPPPPPPSFEVSPDRYLVNAYQNDAMMVGEPGTPHQGVQHLTIKFPQGIHSHYSNTNFALEFKVVPPTRAFTVGIPAAGKSNNSISPSFFEGIRPISASPLAYEPFLQSINLSEIPNCDGSATRTNTSPRCLKYSFKGKDNTADAGGYIPFEMTIGLKDKRVSGGTGGAGGSGGAGGASAPTVFSSSRLRLRGVLLDDDGSRVYVKEGYPCGVATLGSPNDPDRSISASVSCYEDPQSSFPSASTLPDQRLFCGALDQERTNRGQCIVNTEKCSWDFECCSKFCRRDSAGSETGTCTASFTETLTVAVGSHISSGLYSTGNNTVLENRFGSLLEAYGPLRHFLTFENIPYRDNLSFYPHGIRVLGVELDNDTTLSYIGSATINKISATGTLANDTGSSWRGRIIDPPLSNPGGGTVSSINYGTFDCRTHSDCASGICEADGSCMPLKICRRCTRIGKAVKWGAPCCGKSFVDSSGVCSPVRNFVGVDLAKYLYGEISASSGEMTTEARGNSATSKVYQKGWESQKWNTNLPTNRANWIYTSVVPVDDDRLGCKNRIMVPGVSSSTQIYPYKAFLVNEMQYRELISLIFEFYHNFDLYKKVHGSSTADNKPFFKRFLHDFVNVFGQHVTSDDSNRLLNFSTSDPSTPATAANDNANFEPWQGVSTSSCGNLCGNLDAVNALSALAPVPIIGGMAVGIGLGVSLSSNYNVATSGNPVGGQYYPTDVFGFKDQITLATNKIARARLDSKVERTLAMVETMAASLKTQFNLKYNAKFSSNLEYNNSVLGGNSFKDNSGVSKDKSRAFSSHFELYNVQAKSFERFAEALKNEARGYHDAFRILTGVYRRKAKPKARSSDTSINYGGVSGYGDTPQKQERNKTKVANGSFYTLIWALPHERTSKPVYKPIKITESGFDQGHDNYGHPYYDGAVSQATRASDYRDLMNDGFFHKYAYMDVAGRKNDRELEGVNGASNFSTFMNSPYSTNPIFWRRSGVTCTPYAVDMWYRHKSGEYHLETGSYGTEHGLRWSGDMPETSDAFCVGQRVFAPHYEESGLSSTQMGEHRVEDKKMFTYKQGMYFHSGIKRRHGDLGCGSTAWGNEEEECEYEEGDEQVPEHRTEKSPSYVNMYPVLEIMNHQSKGLAGFTNQRGIHSNWNIFIHDYYNYTRPYPSPGVCLAHTDDQSDSETNYHPTLDKFFRPSESSKLQLNSSFTNQNSCFNSLKTIKIFNNPLIAGTDAEIEDKYLFFRKLKANKLSPQVEHLKLISDTNDRDGLWNLIALYFFTQGRRASLKAFAGQTVTTSSSDRTGLSFGALPDRSSTEIVEMVIKMKDPTGDADDPTGYRNIDKIEIRDQSDATSALPDNELWLRFPYTFYHADGEDSLFEDFEIPEKSFSDFTSHLLSAVSYDPGSGSITGVRDLLKEYIKATILWQETSQLFDRTGSGIGSAQDQAVARSGGVKETTDQKDVRENMARQKSLLEVARATTVDPSTDGSDPISNDILWKIFELMTWNNMPVQPAYFLTWTTYYLAKVYMDLYSMKYAIAEDMENKASCLRNVGLNIHDALNNTKQKEQKVNNEINFGGNRRGARSGGNQAVALRAGSYGKDLAGKGVAGKGDGKDGSGKDGSGVTAAGGGAGGAGGGGAGGSGVGGGANIPGGQGGGLGAGTQLQQGQQKERGTLGSDGLGGTGQVGGAFDHRRRLAMSIEVDNQVQSIIEKLHQNKKEMQEKFGGSSLLKEQLALNKFSANHFSAIERGGRKAVTGKSVPFKDLSNNRNQSKPTMTKEPLPIAKKAASKKVKRSDPAKKKKVIPTFSSGPFKKIEKVKKKKVGVKKDDFKERLLKQRAINRRPGESIFKIISKAYIKRMYAE